MNWLIAFSTGNPLHGPGKQISRRISHGSWSNKDKILVTAPIFSRNGDLFHDRRFGSGRMIENSVDCSLIVCGKN